ncbi:MAG: hypothetical protein KKD44_28665 [Proteobacteria bacterium]|nr:hypothetical protein [Pseudomonadota bacterium]
MYRIKKNTLMVRPRGYGGLFGDYGDTFRTPDWMKTRIMERFNQVRQSDTHGFNMRGLTLGPEIIRQRSAKKPSHYGMYAIGSGVVSAAAGAGAYFAPVSKPVKILFGVISGLAGCGAVYSTAKYVQAKRIEAGRDESEKGLASNATWLKKLNSIDKFKNKEYADKIQSYLDFNKISRYSKFVNFDTLQIEGKDPVTGIGADVYYDNYPEWIDKDKITVGEKTFNKKVHNWLNDHYAQQRYSSTVQYEKTDIDGYRTNEEPELGIFNNYGLMNRDAWISYKGANFFSCANPPVKNGWPVWYNILYTRVWDGEGDPDIAVPRQYFVNGNNYNQWTTNFTEIPNNAIIVGTRFLNSPPLKSDYALDDFWNMVREAWAHYGSLTYEDIFEGRVDEYFYNESLQQRLLTRPDLWMFGKPMLPSSIEEGKWDYNTFPFIRKLNFYGEPSDFMQSGLFQPYGLNCRYLCCTKDDFIKLISAIHYRLPPPPDNSGIAGLLKMIAIVIVVVAALITTVASWGTDTVPGWATAVSLIAGILAQGLNLAAKYLDNPEEFKGTLLEGVAGLWSGIKGSLENTDIKLNTHFSKSALVFVEKVKDFSGRVIATADAHYEQIEYALKTVGNNIVGGDEWNSVQEWLGGVVDLPSLSEGTRKQIQDAIVDATQGTQERFIEEKIKAEVAVRTKVSDMNEILRRQGIDKLAVLY